MRFDVRGDVKAIERHLNKMGRELVPKATVEALNKTAVFVEDKAIAELKRSFDRPTNYTKRALVVKRATLQRPVAEVKVKDQTQSGVAPVKYLDDHIYSTRRAHKPFELLLIKYFVMPHGMYAVPAAGAQIDSYGNMRPQQISSILSDLRARRDPKQNITDTSRKRRLRSRTRRPVFYFSTYSRGPSARAKHLAPGVYQRVHTGFGSAIRPVLIFTRAPRYRHRFRFFETADQVARMRFPLEFALAMRKAIAASY